MKPLNIGLSIAALAAINFCNIDSSPLQHLNGSTLVINALQEEKPILSFSSSVKHGKQQNQLEVLVSTDFSGEYTEDAIKKAKWQPVSQNVKLATGEEFESSGEVDLASLVKKKKTYHVAFKYTGAESTTGKPTQRTWTVNNIKIGNQDFKSLNIVNSATNDETTGWIKSNGGVTFRPAATLNKSEGWAIIAVNN